MHTLLFLEPGHFHATLTLRSSHPRVSDEIVVYAADSPERRDFLALVQRFNDRAERSTRWHPVVIEDPDPLSRLIAERRGDVVVLAGKNGGKARTIARLHDAGFHVLADKPWVVEAGDLAHVRPSLDGWPLAMEIATGRHSVAARMLKRLVDAGDLFGDFSGAGPAIELDSIHQLDKRVDGAPLRRPWWFFDVRVQGSGVVDIPTHQVDQTQWLVDVTGVAPGEVPRLVSLRAWATDVPADAFRRITGEGGFPPELEPAVSGSVLGYRCNAEMTFRIGHVTARTSSRWNLSASRGAVDEHSAVARGTRADIRMEQGPRTGHRRRLFVEPHGDGEGVRRALADAVAAVQGELPGVRVDPAGPGRSEVTIPDGLDAGHESHFPSVLDDFLTAIDERRWPAALAERTLAKYTLLAEAAAKEPR